MASLAFRRPVVCVGEILVDLIAPPNETLATASAFAIREGGAPLNAAVGLARLGTKVSFCGAVGDDPFGTRLRQLAAMEGVDVTALQTISGESTSIAYAWRDERGDGQFHLLRLADRRLSPEHMEAAGIDSAAALLVGSVAMATSPSREAILHAVDLATANNVPVVFDVNVRPSIWPNLAELRRVCQPVLDAATALKVSLDDAQFLWGVSDPAEVAREASRPGLGALVMTDGSRGAYFEDDGGDIQHIPVFEVDPVDPTGAGDAFTAALVTRLVQNDWAKIEEADILYAMGAGALATTQQGAIAALPTASELREFLDRRGVAQ